MIQIQHRRGTASQWTSANPILAAGELGVETDTLKVKLGDGSADWVHLPYFTQGAVGPANVLSIGTVVQGLTASATITGTSPAQVLNLVLPKGDAATVAAGTTTTSLPGTSANVTNSGTTANAVFNFTIPRGTTTALGSTTTLAAGSSATVTNSGTASDIILNFGIPQGVGVPTGGTTGQVVQKTATATQWVDYKLSALGDVTITSPTTGQAVTYDGTKWVNATPVSALSGLSDVTISSPVDKQVLKYSSATSKWINAVATGGVTNSATAPASPNAGDAWYDTTTGTMYVYYTDANSSQWVQVVANSALDASLTTRVGGLETRTTALEGVFKLNPQTIDSNYTIPSGFNAMSAGPITISSGVVVTIPSGSSWSVV